jgi:EAL domain-containing protein (putative c-di-GMP-specific phosphodiesterase class I)
MKQIQLEHAPDKGMLAYGQKTGKKTILEGIETPADLDIAQSIGFNFVHGFLFR